MKRTSLLSVAAVCLLAQCNKAPQATAPISETTPEAVAAAPSLPLITANASPHFTQVAQHLELGGAYFNYAEQHRLMEGIAIMLDDIVAKLPPQQRTGFPKDLSFVKLFNDLGFNDVKALGSSSHIKSSGLYHSRTFALMPNGRKGWTTLNGGEAEPFLTLQVAPRGTDLALEFPLHLKAIAKETLNWIELAPEAERAHLRESLSAPVPVLGISTQGIIEKLDARLGLFVRVYPDQQLPVPGAEVPVPGLDALLVAERVGWLLEPLKQQFLPMLNNPLVPVKVTDEDGVLTLSFKEPMGPAPMDYQPVLRFDSKADRLMLATRVSFLQQALDAKELLATTPEFQAAWEGMPEKGNAAIYLSPIFQKTLQSLSKSAVAVSNDSPAYKDMMTNIINSVSPYLGNGQAICLVNQPNGTLSMANMVMPMSNTSALTTLTTLSIISSLAVPTFNSIQVKANQLNTMKQGREIHMALNAYSADHLKFPDNLKQLEDDNLITIKGLSAMWLYDATLTPTSPGNAIVLASEPFKGGSRCVVRLNGSAEVLSEGRFAVETNENLTYR